jgi:hypothetical protein
MRTDDTRESTLMDATGLGLLPGITLAMGLIVVSMAALLTGSMWAVAGVLVMIGLCVGAIVFIVLAVSTEGERGRRMRGMVPGLNEPDSPER